MFTIPIPPTNIFLQEHQSPIYEPIPSLNASITCKPTSSYDYQYHCDLGIWFNGWWASLAINYSPDTPTAQYAYAFIEQMPRSVLLGSFNWSLLKLGCHDDIQSQEEWKPSLMGLHHTMASLCTRNKTDKQLLITIIIYFYLHPHILLVLKLHKAKTAKHT